MESHTSQGTGADGNYRLRVRQTTAPPLFKTGTADGNSQINIDQTKLRQHDTQTNINSSAPPYGET